jgi:hypothetical protein
MIQLMISGKRKGAAMLKKLALVFIPLIAALQLCGCAAVLMYLAESAKEKQDIDVSYGEAFDIVKAGLKPAGVKFVRARIEQNVGMVKGEYTDGRTVRILITRLGDNRSSIAVRVGTSEAGKEDAKKILKAILDYADLIRQPAAEPVAASGQGG